MDGSTVAAFATTATALVGGALAILKVLVDRHLAALTRLEDRATETAKIQDRIALAIDAVRDHLIDIRRDVERVDRGVTRLLDAAQLTETASAPMPQPAEVPRARMITGHDLKAYADPPSSSGGASRPRG